MARRMHVMRHISGNAAGNGGKEHRRITCCGGGFIPAPSEDYPDQRKPLVVITIWIVPIL